MERERVSRGKAAMSEAASPDQLEPVTQKLIAPSRGAHQKVDVDDTVCYWYRLGQANAYAYAAGLVIAEGTDSLAFSIADRITNALSQPSTDVAEVAHAAIGQVQLQPGGEAAPALTWMGPAAFQASYGDLPGIDHDFGMRWGAGGDQRISLRQDIGSDGGLLYVYDPTWDEYAVLLDNVSGTAVQHALANALVTGTHITAQHFAALVIKQQSATTPEARGVGIGVES